MPSPQRLPLRTRVAGAAATLVRIGTSSATGGRGTAGAERRAGNGARETAGAANAVRAQWARRGTVRGRNTNHSEHTEASAVPSMTAAIGTAVETPSIPTTGETSPASP